MRAEDIPLKRHTDTCHGIAPITCVHSLYPLKRHTDTYRGVAIYKANPFIVPTREAYGYLPWNCYLYCSPTHYAHSRGILILAVELLPISHAHSRGILIFAMGLLLISHAHSLRPLKRHSDTCRGTATGSFSSPLYAPLKRQHSVAWTPSQFSLL